MTSFINAVGTLNEICQKFASFQYMKTENFTTKTSDNGNTILFVCNMTFSGQNSSDSSLIKLASSAEGHSKKWSKNAAAERLLEKMRESGLPHSPPHQKGMEDRSVAAEREKEIAEIRSRTDRIEAAHSHEKKEMESMIGALKEQCSAMIQNVSALKEECSALKEKVSALEVESTNLNEKVTMLWEEPHEECEMLTVQNEQIVAVNDDTGCGMAKLEICE